MPTKIVFCPPIAKTIMDVARGMVPDGYELDVLERDDPRFALAMKEAEYLMGFPRPGMDAAFYRQIDKEREFLARGEQQHLIGMAHFWWTQ